jgi:hypothetical protein
MATMAHVPIHVARERHGECRAAGWEWSGDRPEGFMAMLAMGISSAIRDGSPSVPRSVGAEWNPGFPERGTWRGRLDFRTVLPILFCEKTARFNFFSGVI